MLQDKEVFEGEEYSFEVVKGAVVDVQTWTSTTTSHTSSGGGGYIHQGTGYVSAPTASVTMTTKTELQIFVKDEKDREWACSVPKSFPTRTGSRLSGLWLRHDGRSTGIGVGPSPAQKPQSADQLVPADGSRPKWWLVRIVNLDSGGVHRFGIDQLLPVYRHRFNMLRIGLFAILCFGLFFQASSFALMTLPDYVHPPAYCQSPEGKSRFQSPEECERVSSSLSRTSSREAVQRRLSYERGRNDYIVAATENYRKRLSLVQSSSVVLLIVAILLEAIPYWRFRRRRRRIQASIERRIGAFGTG